MLDSGTNIEQQIQFYQRKYELNPHSRAFAPLADLYRKAGRLEEAIEVLEAGLAEHPRYVSALVILARCHVDAGRPTESGEAFTRVLALDPDNLVALKNLAEMALAADDNARGAEFLERVVFLDPTDELAATRLDALRGGVATPAFAESKPVPVDDESPDSAAMAMPAPTDVTEPTTGAALPLAGEDAVADCAAAEPVATGEAAAEPDALSPVQERQSFATRTLAEIYLAQGYREKALTVLREILSRHPDRLDVVAKIEEIQSQPSSSAPSGAPAPQALASSPPPATENRLHFEAWLGRVAKPEEGP